MAIDKGMFRRAVETGEGNRRLTPAKVRLIREMLSDGGTLRAVAARFRVSCTAIGDVKSGKSWSHVR